MQRIDALLRQKGYRKGESMKIGIMGLTCDSGNKGCEALSYSFLSILNEIAKKNSTSYDVYSFEVASPNRTLASLSGQWPLRKKYPKTEYSNLSFRVEPYRQSIFEKLTDSAIKKCDLVFDFTAGDSFTDIYGVDRAKDRMKYKSKVLSLHVPLVLGAQTIGPFNNQEVEDTAKRIIMESKEVFVRDDLSYNCVYDISGRTAVKTCDVAFALPYNKREKKERIVGFNPSGLLWAGGYTKDNQFQLTVDYRKYCLEVITELLKRGCEIHLIAHATNEAKTGTFSVDNDEIACAELKSEFPELIMEEKYITPMDAKSFISGMDFFIGARMHATIAGVSSCVATVPFSYSRKFEGLFDSIGYEYLIHGRGDTTESAINKTIEYFDNRKQIEKKAAESFGVAKERLNAFISGVEQIISDVDRERI